MVLAAERTDLQVVRDVLSGDRDAYRLLVRRYGGVLHRHALRMSGNPDVAADLVQRAFVKGYQRLHTCREPDRVGAWLFRILANICRDHLRSPRRLDVSLQSVAEVAQQGSDPSEHAAQSELRDRIGRALDRLTPEQREAFVLKHVEGLSYEEMAAMMDRSVPAMKMRVQRAREALRSLLGELA
jgi:RNA polymerase sigma-70 factor (ECF subfamily)